jgi:hypothetical protein
MTFTLRFGFILIKWIIGTVLWLFVLFASERIFNQLKHWFRMISFGGMKTKILAPVVALKK